MRSNNSTLENWHKEVKNIFSIRFQIFFLPESKVIISKTRTFLWSFPKRTIFRTARSSSRSVGVLYIGLQIKEQDLLPLFEYFNDENGNLTSRKFDKILISLKMFTFLNNFYFLLLCCKNFLSFKTGSRTTVRFELVNLQVRFQNLQNM